MYISIKVFSTINTYNVKGTATIQVSITYVLLKLLFYHTIHFSLLISRNFTLSESESVTSVFPGLVTILSNTKKRHDSTQVSQDLVTNLSSLLEHALDSDQTSLIKKFSQPDNNLIDVLNKVQFNLIFVCLFWYMIRTYMYLLLRYLDLIY